MNYYPFHLGDYAAHTSHLTWEEDLIYRRLLDVYYLRERALDPDTKKLARVIRMPKAITAIELVLSEFFTLQDDGWHNKRADAELVAMGEKKEVSEEKNSHEKDRQKRFRERRAAMFEALRVVGAVPAWDVSMKDLQRLFEEHCNAPETAPETHLQRYEDVSGNAPLTAIPIPIPTPTPIVVVSPPAPPADKGSRLDAGWKLPKEWSAWCRENRPDLDAALTADQFRDFWVSKPGKDGRKSDWFATWRNWCRAQKAPQAGRRGGDGADWTGSAL